MIPALVTLAVTAVVANAYPNAEPVVAIQRSWRRVLAGRAATVIQRFARGYNLRFQTRRVVNYRGAFLDHGWYYMSPFHLLDLRRDELAEGDLEWPQWNMGHRSIWSIMRITHN